MTYPRARWSLLFGGRRDLLLELSAEHAVQAARIDHDPDPEDDARPWVLRTIPGGFSAGESAVTRHETPAAARAAGVAWLREAVAGVVVG